MNLRTYIDQERGRAAKLARDMKIPPVLISQWASGRQVPAERCPEIEKATSGEVTCEELRPDVDWAYLRGSMVPHVEAPALQDGRRMKDRRASERRDIERRGNERRAKA